VKAIEARRLIEETTLMKRLIQFALFAVASFVAVNGAHAQNLATANIPFDFTVQDKAMPHGDYVVGKLHDSFVVELRSKDGKTNVLCLTYPTDKVAGQGGKLIFHRLGDQYFLNEVQAASSDSGMRLPTSKTEKRARQNEASLPSNGVAVIAMK
jgi:hypothetical protein